MLVLPLKPAVRYDLMSALATWLDDSDAHVSFQRLTNPLQFVLPKPEFDSVACRDDLLRLQGLRYSLSDVFLKPTSHKHAMEVLEDCYDYHAVLLEFEKRGFPTLDDELTGIRLIWKGAFAPSSSSSQERHATLVWERACVTFNIVALLTDKIADCNVTDREECKQTVAYCQQGAGLLQYLKELVSSQDFATVDLSSAMLTFWEKYLMATAQTSIYRMASLAADPKHTTLSVLAQSSYQLFNEALQATQDARLVSEVPSDATEWGGFCKAVSMLQAGKAEYHQSVTHRLAHEWGWEIARLQQCWTKLKACQDFCKTMDADGIVSYTKRECLAIMPVVKDRLHEADKDNHKIYQDTIPQTVADIQGKQLAKASQGLPESMIIPKKAAFVGL